MRTWRQGKVKLGRLLQKNHGVDRLLFIVFFPCRGGLREAPLSPWTRRSKQDPSCRTESVGWRARAPCERASRQGAHFKDVVNKGDVDAGFKSSDLVPWREGSTHGSLETNPAEVTLWMDEVLHHFETMGSHCLLVFTGESFIPGFLRWCNIFVHPQ